MIGAEGVSPVSCASCWFICRQLADLDGLSGPLSTPLRNCVPLWKRTWTCLVTVLPSNCATEREPQECGVWFDRWSLPRGGDGWVSVGLVRRGGVLHVRRYASVAWSPGGGLLRGWALFCPSSSFLPIPSLSGLEKPDLYAAIVAEPWWSSPQYGATSSDGATLFLPEMQPSRAYFGRAYPYGRLPIEALLAAPLSRTNLVASDIPRKSGVLDKGVSILPKFLMLAPVPLTGLVFGCGGFLVLVPVMFAAPLASRPTSVIEEIWAKYCGAPLVLSHFLTAHFRAYPCGPTGSLVLLRLAGGYCVVIYSASGAVFLGDGCKWTLSAGPCTDSLHSHEPHTRVGGSDSWRLYDNEVRKVLELRGFSQREILSLKLS
eukprot:g15401.t1